MKTKSILYAIGITLLAISAAVPVSAQIKFASATNLAFSPRDKLVSTNFLNYYASTERDRSGRDIGTTTFPSPSPAGKNNTITGENGFSNKIDNPIDLAGNKPGNSVNTANRKISFKRTSFTYPVGPGKDVGIADYSAEQLMLYATMLKQYARKNGCDTTYAFFSNMGMLNNKKRFFVVNLITMQIELTGLVAQGRGQGASRFDKQYSNKKDSRCTSLGRYKILKKYKGEYGAAYRMAGLDSSNCNAFKRNIVLHSMGCMPEQGENMPVCISEGCPAVSINFLSSLGKIIDSRKKPVLLWIFDSNLEEVVVEKPLPETSFVDERIYHRCSMHQAGSRIKADW